MDEMEFIGLIEVVWTMYEMVISSELTCGVFRLHDKTRFYNRFGEGQVFSAAIEATPWLAIIHGKSIWTLGGNPAYSTATPWLAIIHGGIFGLLAAIQLIVQGEMANHYPLVLMESYGDHFDASFLLDSTLISHLHKDMWNHGISFIVDNMCTGL
ncbi:hypothetical protein COLO4_30168 [Corchorus olitorius]|uniref:Uncharacterized protein n=1 Tax=Corchorus olitorius TaxID=93759 RepID=A0A1R3HAY4_9ROSI|nr:hypothetical protein COLO4_30168 [Corchorus olitorius]